MKLRALQSGDEAAVHALHDAVRAALPEPSMFQLWGGAEAFVASHLPGPCSRGESWGIWAPGQDAQLLAYASLTLPQANDADNYARQLGWPADRAARVGLLSAAMVLPAARGQGLQGRLIEQRVARAAELGLDEVLARSSPLNGRSRQALMHRGFAIVWLGEQVAGLQRHLFWRSLQAGRSLGDALHWVDEADLAAQRQQLDLGRIGRRLHAGRIGFA